ncbi:MAG: PQQ-binding-like beta-propeller repeat protein [Acidobacteriota bacterium]
MERTARFTTNQPLERNRNGFLGLACVAFLVTAFATSAAFGADWPTWRGTSSNAAASSETINLPLTLGWHTTAPAVEENGVVVAGGIAYMASANGQLYAFTVATGVAVPGFPVTTGTNNGTPAVDVANGKIYALGGGTTLFAFNLNGSPAWTAIVGALGTNYSEGPLLDGGFVYVKAGGQLLKYSSAGVQQYSVPCPDSSSQPALSGAFLYSNSGGTIRKYDKATGAEVLGGGFPISTASSVSSVTVVDGFIFFKADQLYVYKISDGTLAWSKPDGGNSTYSGSPATVSGGAVYTYGFDGRLYAFDENTGATITGFPSVQLNTGGRDYSSPSVAGDKVFVGAGTTQKLKVVGAAGTGSAGQVLAEYATFSTDPQGFDLCSPAISDGWVFAMLDGGGLYAFYASGTAPPNGGISINSGAACTTSASVVLSINNFGDPSITQMIISESPFFTGAVYEAYAATKNWTLSAGFGLKTVYAKLKTSGGVESNVFSATIDYEAICQAGPTPTPTPTPTGTPGPSVATAIPTLSSPMFGLLALALVGAALFLIRQ